MEHLIRKLREEELDRLVELCQNHAEYEKKLYLPSEKRELLKNAIFSDTPRLYCFVIESNNLLVGYFSYTFDFSTWDARLFLYLDCLYLEPDFRGSGIGAKIFAMLKEIARESDCINIQWQTPVFNHRAINFYNRMNAIGKEKIRFELTDR